jgi:hypothetical protein
MEEDLASSRLSTMQPGPCPIFDAKGLACIVLYRLMATKRQVQLPGRSNLLVRDCLLWILAGFCSQYCHASYNAAI